MEGVSGQSKAPGSGAVQRLRRQRAGLLAVFSRERRRREGRWREVGKSREQGEKEGSGRCAGGGLELELAEAQAGAAYGVSLRSVRSSE
jgi:hypothetical protein